VNFPIPRFRYSPGRLKLRACLSAIAAIGIFLGAVHLRAQTAALLGSDSATSQSAAITSLRIVQEKDGPAVEILSTKPLAPSIQALSNPPRIVIDLPNVMLDGQKKISIQADQINALRANQFQQDPPVARVVVDLEVARPYTWDATGNRLIVHLGRNPNDAVNSPFQAPVVASVTSAPQPVVMSVRAAGPLAIAGNAGNRGSSITAGADTAILNLSSGGEVRVCPGTTVSAVPSENRHNVLLSMNTGSLETHLALDSSSDSVLTPDFSIVLAGPGEFHFAISADSHGDTCVRSLPGNTASATVTELIGDRSYEVKATDQLVFRGGRLDRMDVSVPAECGCPPPREAPMRAENSVTVAGSENETQSRSLPPVNLNPPSTGESRGTESGQTGAAAPAEGSEEAKQVPVHVSSPFVFRAGPAPTPADDVAALPFESRSVAEEPALPAPIPPPQASSHVQGFFKKIGAFFTSLFR
jgi:hypothetical protein